MIILIHLFRPEDKQCSLGPIHKHLLCMKMKDTILPLFGRPLLSNRDKWQYSMNDKSNAH